MYHAPHGTRVHSSKLGNGMGNPGVSWPLPIPVPAETRTHTQGYGFFGLRVWVSRLNTKNRFINNIIIH
jgi:hypothetical protein